MLPRAHKRPALDLVATAVFCLYCCICQYYAAVVVVVQQ